MNDGIEAIRVVVVEPGWTAWFLVGVVAGIGLSFAAVTLLIWWAERE